MTDNQHTVNIMTMPARSETRQPYQDNPATISEQALDRVFNDLPDDPISARHQFRYLQGHKFGDIFTDNFQIMRLGILGWEIDIPEELRIQYGISETTIDTKGPKQADDTNEAFYDYMTGANLMRSVVVGAFDRQADISGLSSIKINDDVIDAHPVRKEFLDEASAAREGAFMFDADALEEQWRGANTDFYNKINALIYDLSVVFAERTAGLYGHFDPQLLETLKTDMRENWIYHLKKEALKAYAMFTPHAPELLEVPVRSS